MGDAVDTIQKGTSLYSNIVDAGSNFGRYLAERGMSAESAALANQMGQVKENSRGDNLADCGRKAAITTLTGQKLNSEICSPDALEVGKELGGKAVSKAVYGAVSASTGRVLGMVFDAASTAIETRNNHMDAIRLLSQKDFPGMSYQEQEMDGHKVRVWADALGAGLYPNEPKTKTYVDVQNLSGDTEAESNFRSSNYRKLDALEKVVSSQALESVQNYTAANGVDALKQKLTEAPEVMADLHQAEQAVAVQQKQALRAPAPAYNAEIYSR